MPILQIKNIVYRICFIREKAISLAKTILIEIFKCKELFVRKSYIISKNNMQAIIKQLWKILRKLLNLDTMKILFLKENIFII